MEPLDLVALQRGSTVGIVRGLRWHIPLFVLAFVLTACSGTASTVSSPGFRAGSNSIQLTAELQPSRVTGGKAVRALSIPACSSSAIIQAVSVTQRRLSATSVQIIFTTTLRNRNSTPCGIGEFQTCAHPGAIALANAHGDTVWQWAPPQLMRRCDPSVLSELPMSISSPRITFIDNLLSAGWYVVTTHDSSARVRFRLR